MRTILALSLGVVLCAVTHTATGQSLPAMPSGFQLDPTSVSYAMRGTKANDSMSPCFGDPKIIFSYGWVLNPASKMMIDMLVKAPQEPASNSSQTGALDEPVSKQAYKNGVLEWRRQTWPVITGHPCKDSHVIFYSGKWTGYSGDKMIGISVDRLYNSKDQGQGWIDEYITKVIGALNSQ
jgi:hypothetical protein